MSLPRRPSPDKGLDRRKDRPLVRVEGLGVQRSGRWLVRDVDLTVSRGEIVALIGPNGAGKTTTAKAILGIEAPSAGRVTLARGTRIGYVPQRLAIDWTLPLTVRHLMTLTARHPRAAVERALADLEAWSAAHPGDYAARRAVAVAYLQAGRHEDATAAHEALLAAQPNDLVLLNNLALLYHRAGDPRAMDYARRAYELAPLEPAAIDTLGWILVQDGEVERGLALLREAYVRGGDNPQVRYHIAVALNRLGRTEAARAELQAALTAGREFDGIDQARRLMEQLSGS